ncbi:MAG TPA: KTSC domain-containing protein [Acidobacteriota bacterium]|nr:KTSC domain-containing protein [Acidobacteriota bacterium]
MPVCSSNIRYIGYDPESKILELEFHSGSIYQYYEAPENIYQSIMRSASKGSYFHNYTKSRHSYRQVR